MTAPVITTLIDKQDTQEIVRDQIAAILLLESTRQQALAQEAGKNPDLWALRVFTERSVPWEEFPKAITSGVPADFRPIVNVSWDTSRDDEHASNSVDAQLVVGNFNLDCYGAAPSRDTDDGHAPGDREAAFEAQRAAKLVRNILMAGQYTYLGMRGVVGRRWRDSATAISPTTDSRPLIDVEAVRIVFRVQFLEYSPQVEGVTLELISVAVKRADTGEILFTADFPQESDE